MPDLTFFTTSQTKLAHARYVAERRQIKIKGFRQRTYHADYVEPRLASREQILRASYDSAKEQLAKAGFSEASHPFILEDTSVRIEALSSSDSDCPGVDIKYWMQEQTFSNLDSMLRSRGNDRRALVRSDILLHVPSNFRKNWAVNGDFILFTGRQSGNIVDTEHEFNTNLVYPWLDNRSFNKWFVPDGAMLPFGALSIALADQVDFRRKSLEKLFEFLQDRRYFAAPRAQFKLPLDHRPNIILCGYTCSGKTTASQHLARRFGYLHIEASDFMHLAYYYRHGYRGPTAIGDFAEQALAENPTIAAERVVEYLRDHPGDPVVVSGFRAPEEIAFLESEMKKLGKTFNRYFVRASRDLRYARLCTRGRPGDKLTIEEFCSRETQQQRMGLDAISGSPNTLTVNNESSLARIIHDPLRLVDCLPPFSAEPNS
jgi:inosine/xanthosine triphosphate pyrophosphatase family protein/dephospho-CoA kinase